MVPIAPIHPESPLLDYMAPPNEPCVRNKENVETYCNNFAKWLISRGLQKNVHISRSSPPTIPIASPGYASSLKPDRHLEILNWPKENGLAKSKQEVFRKLSGDEHSEILKGQAMSRLKIDPVLQSRNTQDGQTKISISKTAIALKQPSPSGSSGNERKRKTRDTSDGTVIWFNSILERAGGSEANLTQAYQAYSLLLPNGALLLPGDQERHRYILTYRAPDVLVDEFASPFHFRLLFTVGIYTLTLVGIYTKRPESFTETFSLATIQDRASLKRKIPIPILAACCEFYCSRGWIERIKVEGDLFEERVTAPTRYRHVSAMPKVLSPSDLAELARSF